MWFWPVNRMSLRPGLLWLTLNLALIIQKTYISFNFTYTITRFRVPRKMSLSTPRGVRVLQVEDHLCTVCTYVCVSLQNGGGGGQNMQITQNRVVGRVVAQCCS
jgi:hypothetical protein